MLHAGVMKKFGLYGLLRIALPMLPDAVRQWSNLLLLLLLANIIYIGFVTLAQRRLDWMLGYSSVMHMGYIFLGIVSVNLLGATGAAMLMLAHGLSIALLFAITGELRARLPSLEFEALGGLAKAMPIASFSFGLGAFAAIGLPGFANFPGEIMVVFGAFQNGFDQHRFQFFQWAALFALWGVVMSAVYMLRAYRRIFFGRTGSAKVADLPFGLRLPIALLVISSLFFGFFPQTVVRTVVPAFKNYLSAAK
jgi:NADH-quinone oxidoreductase subunit M